MARKAQGHGDRLTAVDAGFLAQEGPNAHMQIGAVMVFEGPPPSYEAFADHLRGRLHLVPRFRQKVAFPPLETGLPLWIDDPDFALDYHLRYTALPAPGLEDQLRALVARVFSQGLDRARPLWEFWLVRGLEGDRFALISKNHHALVDGVAGMDLATVVFDLGPVPQPVPHEERAWVPEPEPGAAALAARGVAGLARLPLTLGRRALEVVARPGEALDAVRDGVEGLGEVVWAALNPAPATPLNVPIGPHRRMLWVRMDLGDFKKVKNAFGGTVNDAVLAVVTGALRRWLRAREVPTQGLELRALVPVSIRTRDEAGRMGNRIVAMRGALPVYVEDPVERLGEVRTGMDGLKESKQALGAEVLTSVQNVAPPAVLAQASRINFTTRLFNLLVTNIPGPQFPLYVLGRELQDLVPVAFLPKEHALAIAAISYAGGLDFGLIADYDVVPDLDDIGRYLEASLAELVGAASAPGNGGAARAGRAGAASAAQ